LGSGFQGKLQRISPPSAEDKPDPLLVTPEAVKPDEDEPLLPTQTAPSKPAPTEPTNKTLTEEPEAVPEGGSYTENDREARIQAWIAKKDELERRIRDALTIDILPGDEHEQSKPKLGEFKKDDVYRQAVLKYECENHRHPVAKGDTQEGHDIDSYTHGDGHSDRKLIRRIEVKGRSRRWDNDETVEMSDSQFKDALSLALAEDEEIDPDFDYWLYVVERHDDGELEVLQIRNAAKKAAHFALKGGTWRHQAEKNSSEELQ
jgi:hypothetical protein